MHNLTEFDCRPFKIATLMLKVFGAFWFLGFEWFKKYKFQLLLSWCGNSVVQDRKGQRPGGAKVPTLFSLSQKKKRCVSSFSITRNWLESSDRSHVCYFAFQHPQKKKMMQNKWCFPFFFSLWLIFDRLNLNISLPICSSHSREFGACNHAIIYFF